MRHDLEDRLSPSSPVPCPPAELMAFAERQVRNTRGESRDRRYERRHLMVIPAALQAVDSQGRAAGPIFSAVTRDISAKAIGLIHVDSVCHKNLALRLNLAGDDVSVVVELVWCQPLGPFYFSGCRFLAKLGEFPEDAQVISAAHS